MKSVKVSQRLQDQIPAFIKEEDQSFVDLLVQYYKSQEKSGKPYDILNNILSYTDISSDEYNPNFISSSSIVLDRIGATDQNITVETVDNFLEKDGTIKIDNEIIFYEETTKSPEVVFTPGVNKLEFDKKIQELERVLDLLQHQNLISTKLVHLLSHYPNHLMDIMTTMADFKELLFSKYWMIMELHSLQLAKKV